MPGLCAPGTGRWSASSADMECTDRRAPLGWEHQLTEQHQLRGQELPVARSSAPACRAQSNAATAIWQVRAGPLLGSLACTAPACPPTASWLFPCFCSTLGALGKVGLSTAVGGTHLTSSAGSGAARGSVQGVPGAGPGRLSQHLQLVRPGLSSVEACGPFLLAGPDPVWAPPCPGDLHSWLQCQACPLAVLRPVLHERPRGCAVQAHAHIPHSMGPRDVRNSSSSR